LLALGYGSIVSVFNAPDETHHFEYVRYLADNLRLPDQSKEAEATSHEGFNPPLYYAISAALLSVVAAYKADGFVVPDDSDIARFVRRPQGPRQQRYFPPLNPRYRKWGLGRDQNMFLRAGADRFPFRGAIRTIHLLRLLSIPFGLLTIWFVFETTRALFPGERQIALLAAAVCAFNPQFTFLHGYINNDTLVTTFATICFWLLTKLILTRQSDSKYLIALGLCVGLGLLTKLNIGFMIPVSLLAIWLRPSVRGEGLLRPLRDSLFFGLAVLSVSGWYFLRNLALYGLDDPFGWELRALQNPDLAMAPHVRASFLREVFAPRLFTSFWGRFDWLTVSLPTWGYWIYGVVSLMGVVGIGAWARELWARGGSSERRVCFCLYLASHVLALGSLVSLNSRFISAQGRLLFPVIAPICIFIAVGLRGALVWRWPLESLVRDRLVLALILALVGLNLFALIGVIAPVYT